MFEKYTDQAREVILHARREASLAGSSSIGAEHILLGLMQADIHLFAGLHGGILPAREELRKRTAIRHSDMRKGMVSNDITFNADSRQVLICAFEEAAFMSSPNVDTRHLLLGLLRLDNSPAHDLLASQGIDPETVREILTASGGPSALPSGKNKPAPEVSEVSLLSEYCRDLTELAKNDQLDPLIGRNPECERIVQILCRRSRNNPILIGEPGTGKTAITEGLAKRIVDGDVPQQLRNRRILSLDLSLLIAGTKYRGQFEERLKKIMAELSEDPDLLLFIDEIHNIVGAGSAEGSMDAANILKPALSRGEFQCIGATTPREYNKFMEKDRALERRFQVVRIEPPDENESLAILNGIKEKYESFHRVKYAPESLEAAVRLSNRYITDRYLPDKAIDVMDEAGSRLKLEKKAKSRNPVVKKNHVEEVISSWRGIPVESIKEEEIEKLLRIESFLNSRIVSQGTAVSAVSRAIRRSRTGMRNPNRPVGSFLFLGPTGVGKTELAKCLAEFLFGDEKNLVRLDMSEYMEKHSVAKLIGSPPGYVGHEQGGQLTDKIRRNPYSIILMDEIEKAHPDVFNVLLQVLEDGRLTDSHANTIDFRHTIIVITSNCGSRYLEGSNRVGFFTGGIHESRDLEEKIMGEVRKLFNPEFLNRLDEILFFNALGETALCEIVDLLMNQVNENLAGRGIRIELSGGVNAWLVEKCCKDRSYGARPLRRAIQRYIEDPVSDLIIQKILKEEESIFIYVKDKDLYYRADLSGSEQRLSQEILE